ncbi:hypothetical protein SBV1_740009 [Verrucomicrobia bacterium]|nr:hypothetical protein SBV1_740009 [Verrucomicrobiota bacterium]
MANRLRHKQARVSFFAFQDMITTVTGVLLLVTLMLTLYLNQPAPTPDALRRNQAQEQLAAAQRQLEDDLQTLRTREADLKALSKRVFLIAEPDRSGKRPVLIVLSATNGWCTRLGETNVQEFAVRDRHTEFKSVLDTWDPQQDRLVFYVRPSGVAHFEVCRTMAHNRSFDIGYDAADEESQYLLANP